MITNYLQDADTDAETDLCNQKRVQSYRRAAHAFRLRPASRGFSVTDGGTELKSQAGRV